MSRSTKVKICGLTRPEDVEVVRMLDADYFGFIVYAPSPRSLEISAAATLAASIPQSQRILVDVEPELASIEKSQALGFKQFQIHASLEACQKLLPEWSAVIGRDNLWIAPRLPGGHDFPEPILQYADTVLLDTYSSEQAGGTGQTGDWVQFKKLQGKFPKTSWILAGGLSPENVTDALNISSANCLDVNSGVESSPGIKDHEALKFLFHKIASLGKN
jgi:phosphoribosylanthranilate isomerase